tara:strand:+ start:535 stop:1044 length:510 start_codon:yes stop_codon:yes gene_type:complete
MAQDEIEAKSNLFIQQMLEDYKIIEKDARINRYATSGSTWSKRIDLKSKKLFFNKYDQKDYQEYALTFIYFKDSASCLDARRKYLDNYSLKSGALTNSTKYTGRPPSFNLITNNSIIIFEVSCEGHHMDEKWSWNQIKKKLTLMFGSDESEIIENGCGKPITWKNNKDK